MPYIHTLHPQALLHTPATQPEMLSFGHALSPGFEEFVAVSPYMIHADEGIHSLEAREGEFSQARLRNLGSNSCHRFMILLAVSDSAT